MKKNNSNAVTMISVIALAVVLIGIVTALIMERTHERRLLAELLTQASFTAAESLSNPAIFSHEGAEDLASLHQSTRLLNELQTSIANAKIYLTQSSRESALQYLDYLNRVAKKWNEVSEAEALSKEKVQLYQNSLNVLKSAHLDQRISALNAIAQDQKEARNATDLAYQECLLLQRLLEQHPLIIHLVSSNLPASVLIQPTNWDNFQTNLQKEAARRDSMRREFNQTAH